MKTAVASVFAVVAFTAGCGMETKSAHSSLPLTEEQLSVYQGFLDKLGLPLHIKNLATVTIPFDFKGFPDGRPCLNGIELEKTSEPLNTTHTFGPDISKGRELRLVDRHEQMKLFPKGNAATSKQPKQGTEKVAEVANVSNFVIFSEILFDTKHQYAVLKYI